MDTSVAALTKPASAFWAVHDSFCLTEASLVRRGFGADDVHHHRWDQAAPVLVQLVGSKCVGGGACGFCAFEIGNSGQCRRRCCCGCGIVLLVVDRMIARALIFNIIYRFDQMSVVRSRSVLLMNVIVNEFLIPCETIPKL